MSILKDIVTLTLIRLEQVFISEDIVAGKVKRHLKETMAAALIMLTNWHPDKPFIDPFCGSGTIPIEAALIGQNIAPGFNREFVSESWNWFDAKIWDEVRMEAEDVANYDQPLRYTWILILIIAWWKLPRRIALKQVLVI